MSNPSHPLPAPGIQQAYCNVSALEGGILELTSTHFTTSGIPGEVLTAPSLAFLLQHSTNGQNFLFDLGIRKDWHTYPPETVKLIETFGLSIPQDVVESLAKGGMLPSEISTICLSHVHFDHMGDYTLFPKSTLLLGEESKHVLAPEYVEPLIIKDLPLDRTKFLSTVEWQPLGPFPRAFDFYGDGSLYIIDAAGHLPGHLNVLARTSADGAWIFLAGDSAHHWDLVTGKGQIAIHEHMHGFFRCAYLDKEEAERHLARMRELLGMPRVRVLLAHDEPWYNVNKGGGAFWPGKIPSLRNNHATALRRVMREITELKKSPPEGIRIQTNEEDMLDITGVIQGPESTPYAGGYFKVKFKFTEEFPAAPPKCWFATKIFHPNVSNIGEICVNTLKKDWKPTYGIEHILVTVKCLLIYPNPESALDEEAGKLLLENYQSYCDRAKLITSVHATPRKRPV
ncbi:hypothetical protein C0995_013778, partial [Termitomyces sp. Mi166